MIKTFQLNTDFKDGSQRKGLELLLNTIFSSIKKGFENWVDIFLMVNVVLY